MAEYIKKVIAEQYTGDLKAIKKFLEITDAVYDESTRELIIPEFHDKPDNGKWVVKINDFIMKTDEGFIVYKPTRFEKEFELVKTKAEVPVFKESTKVETKSTDIKGKISLDDTNKKSE